MHVRRHARGGDGRHCIAEGEGGRAAHWCGAGQARWAPVRSCGTVRAAGVPGRAEGQRWCPRGALQATVSQGVVVVQDVVVVGGRRHVGNSGGVVWSSRRVSGRRRRCRRQVKLRLVGGGDDGRGADGGRDGCHGGHAVGAAPHLAQLTVQIRVANSILREARC